MKEKIEVKLKQAEEQATLWQRNLAAAQEQVIRWTAVAQVCRELMEADVPVAVQQRGKRT